MRLVSVNVGLPREVASRGRTVLTSIWKGPVAGRVRVGRLNVSGDLQSDLTVHGGPEKAVYVYPSEHYEYWRRELPGTDLPWGAFGENFTTEGLLEEVSRIGDRLRMGSAEFMITQPRMPCYKLGIRFSRDDMVKRFLQSARTGFYLAVLREGEVGAGDAIELTHRDDHGVTVADISALYHSDADNQPLLRRAIDVPALSEDWRASFEARLGTGRMRGAAAIAVAASLFGPLALPLRAQSDVERRVFAVNVMDHEGKEVPGLAASNFRGEFRGSCSSRWAGRSNSSAWSVTRKTRRPEASQRLRAAPSLDQTNTTGPRS